MIDPIINKPNALEEFKLNSWQRLWNLYFAILNTAAEQEKSSSGIDSIASSNGSLLSNSIPLSSSAINHNWSDEKRNNIASKLTTNVIWSEIIASANNSLENIPPQLFVSLVTLSLKHSNNIASTVRPNVEEYLVSIGFKLDPSDLNSIKSYLKLVEIYSTEVLSDDFVLAKSFVESHEVYPDNKKPDLLAKIDENEKSYHEAIKERELQKKEEIARKERERKDLEEERRREREKALIKVRERERQMNQLENEKQANQQEITKKETANENQVNNVSSVCDSAPAAASTRNLWSLLLVYWKSSNLVALKQNKKLILFFIIFFLMAFRQNFRIKIRRLLNNIWSKFFQTIAMGMKVSYV